MADSRSASPADDQQQPEVDAICSYRDWFGTWPPDPRTVCLIVLALLAVGYSLYFGRAILVPIATALLLNFLLSPVVRRLRQWGLPSAMGAALVLLCAVFAVGGVASLTIEPATRWISSAPRNFRDVQAKLQELREPMKEIENASKEIEKLTDLNDDESDATVPVRVLQPGVTNRIVTQTGGLLASVGIVIVLLYFLLAADNRLLRELVSLWPTWHGKRVLVELAYDIECSVSQYLATVTIINMTLGVAVMTVMWGLDMPSPIMWGVMACVLNFAPYVGPLIGIGIVGFSAMISFESLAYAALPPLAYFCLNIVEGQFITPAILGQWMKMNPVLIMVSILFFGLIWGPMGVLLAVPLLSIICIVLRQPFKDLQLVPREPPDSESEASERQKLSRTVAVDPAHGVRAVQHSTLVKP